VVSPHSPKGKAIEKFKHDIELETEGQCEIKTYPNGILFDDKSAIEAVKKNIIQFAAPSFSKFVSYIPDFQIFDIPYLFDNIDKIHFAYVGKIGNILKNKAKHKGFYILAYWDNGFKQITNNIRPVKKPSDLFGLKIRTQGNEVISKQFKLMGAKAFEYPFSKLYSILREGIVNGQENTIDNIYNKRIHTIQNYMTISNHAYLGYAVIVSKKFWDNLDNVKKDKFITILNKATQYEIEQAETSNIKNFYNIKYEAKNLEIYELNEQNMKDWKNFFSKHYDDFFKLIDKEIVEEVYQLNK
jgi:C4-dicarboxylate-binding protein DctP